MFCYYSNILLVTYLVLLILMELVRENARIGSKTKIDYYQTCCAIMVAALAEWGALALNGVSEDMRALHAFAKGMDYIMSPIAGLVFFKLLSDDEHYKKIARIMKFILIGNTALQIVSMFTGWTFYIDSENYYQHGPLHILYTGVYLAVIGLLFYGFADFGKRYPKKNLISLLGILLIVLMGVIIQEIKSEIRIGYLCQACASVLMFIHHNEYSQMESDAEKSYQKKLLDTDVLTGMYSRYAYTDALNEMNGKVCLPKDMTVFSIDLNGLKRVNDTQGHLAGDAYIQSAAACILKVFSTFGRCYRTGGDEFVLILRMTETQMQQAQTMFLQEKGDLSLSYGYARAENETAVSIEKLVQIADAHMYENKRDFYTHHNNDRRRG